MVKVCTFCRQQMRWGQMQPHVPTQVQLWVRDLHHILQWLPHYFFHEWTKLYYELGSRSAVLKILTDVGSTVQNMFTAQWWLDLYIIKQYKEIPNISYT